MALQAFDQELQSAITYIATPAINGSLLTAAPQVAVLLHCLTLLTACLTDVSLKNENTENFIYLLKTPGSFRASLYQTANSISQSFRTADESMFRIYLNLRDVPQIMTSVVGAYAQPTDPAASFLMDLEIRHLTRIAFLCKHEAERTTNSFRETLKLIKELQQVTLTTKGDNEVKIAKNIELQKKQNIEMQNLKIEKEDLQAQIEEQKKMIFKAEEIYDEAAKRMSDDLVVFTAVLEDAFQHLLGLFNFGHMTDSAVGNLQAATLIARDMYLKQVKLQKINLHKDEANRRALVEIGIKIMTTDTEKLNLDEILKSLSAGIKMLGEVQAHWSTLLTYFSKLETIILHPLTNHLSTFNEVVKAKHLNGSEILRKKLTTTGIEAAGLCISVLREAKIYNDLSSNFILPLIDGSAKNLGMTKEEAKALLPTLDERMNRTTEEVDIFLTRKLNESGIQAIGQMYRCYADYLFAQNSTLLID